MKVIRYIKSGPVIIAAFGSGESEHLYVPNERVVLTETACGVAGTDYGLDDSQLTLREARTISRRQIPRTGYTYSDIREFEYDDGKLRQLIQDARLRRELNEKVKKGIDALIKSSRKNK